MNGHQDMNEVRRNINDVRQAPHVINVQEQQNQLMQGLRNWGSSFRASRFRGNIR